jgi:hypothetical protein
MEGVVSSYSSTSLSFTADNSAGSGSLSDWALSLSGDKGTAGGIGSVSAASGLTLAHIATPSAPAAGNTIVYAKTDGKVYKRPAGGAEEEIGSGGGLVTLTANRTYYLAASGGSDSNDGLSAGAPFATFGKFSTVADSIFLAGFNLTLQLADGTYSITSEWLLPKPVGNGTLTLQGNTGSPQNVVISSSVNCITVDNQSTWVVRGMQLTSSSTSLLSAIRNSIINFEAIRFGSATFNHIVALTGGTVEAIGNYQVVGGSTSGAHWYFTGSGKIITSQRTVTMTGAFSFGAAWAWSDRGDGYCECFGMTFTGGTVTGARALLRNNSVCFTNTASTTYLPGSGSVTTAKGAQYGD